MSSATYQIDSSWSDANYDFAIEITIDIVLDTALRIDDDEIGAGLCFRYDRVNWSCLHVWSLLKDGATQYM